MSHSQAEVNAQEGEARDLDNDEEPYWCCSWEGTFISWGGNNNSNENGAWKWERRDWVGRKDERVRKTNRQDYREKIDRD